jgi:hypothetical protein
VVLVEKETGRASAIAAKTTTAETLAALVVVRVFDIVKAP